MYVYGVLTGPCMCTSIQLYLCTGKSVHTEAHRHIHVISISIQYVTSNSTQWCHMGVMASQITGNLLANLFMLNQKETTNPRVTGLLWGQSTDPNKELTIRNVFECIWWHHHESYHHVSKGYPFRHSESWISDHHVVLDTISLTGDTLLFKPMKTSSGIMYMNRPQCQIYSGSNYEIAFKCHCYRYILLGEIGFVTRQLCHVSKERLFLCLEDII